MADASRLEDQPLGYLLNQVALALRTEVTDSVLKPAGLTFPQYICMRILSTAPLEVQYGVRDGVARGVVALNLPDHLGAFARHKPATTCAISVVAAAVVVATNSGHVRRWP